MIKNDHIGDIILSSNVIRELKKAFPKAEITFIASPTNKSIIEKNKAINKVFTLRFSPRKPSEFLNYLKLSRYLKKQKFDLGIDLRGGLFNIFFFLFLPRVKYKVGFYNQYLGKFFLDYARKKTHWTKFQRGHVTQERLYLINDSLNLNATNNWPEISTDKEDEKSLKALIKRRNLKKFICIIPDARKDKQWPLKNFDLLIKSLEKKYPKKQIVLTGSDEKQISNLIKKNPKAIPILGENLRTIYLLFQKSDLVIAHDGGAAHISWVGKSPTLALIEKRLPLEWIKPLGKNSHYIYDELRSLSPDSVIKKIEGILKAS